MKRKLHLLQGPCRLWRRLSGRTFTHLSAHQEPRCSYLGLTQPEILLFLKRHQKQIWNPNSQKEAIKDLAQPTLRGPEGEYMTKPSEPGFHPSCPKASFLKQNQGLLSPLQVFQDWELRKTSWPSVFSSSFKATWVNFKRALCKNHNIVFLKWLICTGFSSSVISLLKKCACSLWHFVCKSHPPCMSLA